MKLREIYQLAIKMGIKADPRNQERIDYLLKKEKKHFSELSKKNKDLFDNDRLVNPYSDTRYFNSDGGKQIKKIMVGIDIDTAEVLLADRLGKIDLIISHHPVGLALSRLNDVMHLQADLLSTIGIPINISEDLLEQRISEVSRRISPLNHYQAVDAAKLLNLAVMCVHTPADNLLYQFIKNLIQAKKPPTLEELIDLLNTIEEYKIASRNGAGPTITVGKPHRNVGKIVVTELTGGTNGAKEIYESLARHGVGTIICMHMQEEHRKEAAKHHINVVVAGHTASDSIGMNLFLDQLEKKGIKIIATSGLIRIKRI